MSKLNASFSCVHSSSSFSQAAFSLAIVLARASLLASQTKVLPASRRLRSAAVALASPQMPTEIFLTKPKLVWSASTWMILAVLGQ